MRLAAATLDRENLENDSVADPGGVKALVEEVLTTIEPPYSEDIIDEVCRAIESRPESLLRYQELASDLGVIVVNNWVGMGVARAIGREGNRRVKARSSLIDSYSKLPVPIPAFERTAGSRSLAIAAHRGR